MPASAPAAAMPVTVTALDVPYPALAKLPAPPVASTVTESPVTTPVNVAEPVTRVATVVPS